MVVAGIIGARGYLGRELMRILDAHPEVGTLLPASSSAAGRSYADLVPGFMNDHMVVSHEDPALQAADVLFLATHNEEAAQTVAGLPDDGGPIVIDLSRQHRIQAIEGGDWHYGMADLEPSPRGSRRIANPGCYPTASILALAPALRAGLVTDGPIIVDGKSGLSGAGAKPRADLHFPEANESVRAYGVIGHDHGEEIRDAAAAQCHTATRRPIRFTPHLVPQTRGLLATAYAPTDADAETVKAAYERTYRDRPFVHTGREPDTSHTRGSQHAHVAVDVDPESGLLVARCAIDNIHKGGAGQAVHNMNQALGLPETTGLERPGWI